MQRAWRISEERIDPLIVEAWPHGETRYEFYEDEGVTEFRCSRQKRELSLEWSGPLPRRTIFHFHGIPQPQKLTLKTEDQPKRVQGLEGVWLDKVYLLAVPEIRSARLSIEFST
jgi:hypothetical protein